MHGRFKQNLKAWLVFFWNERAYSGKLAFVCTAQYTPEDQILENKISGNRILNICTER